MPKFSMSRRILRTCLVLALVSAGAAGVARAATYAEVGDSGQTLGSAQGTGINNTTSLTSIFGSISGGADADLFRITITAPTTFSASTVNAVTMGSNIDTALFLLNSAGAAIYTNDDASGQSFQSTLPAGSSFTLSLNPGTYYLGISLSGNEPINSNGQLLFAGFPSGDTTAVRGPAGGINPNSLANFSGNAFFPESGVYEISLSSVATAVPEPSAFHLALAAFAVFLIRRKRARRASSH